ncbi:MAG TPA: phosphoglycerate dehydrogenase [Syntrophorhabdaceae bacterium]|nr:phosphoglycerate dehydrogenase [Syntrophorhabdaceae bacterium]
MKVLIADQLSEKALEILKSNNLEVDVRVGLKAEELKEIIGGYDALIVRSATKATREIIEKADKLKVIGRAGIGVDNVDVAAATEKGIIVMNTPQGNALAAAEHSIALMFAAARKIALADRTMKQGKWEKKALMGIEIYGKTLGVIGIGNIGSLVAEKALALGMRVIAYDIYVSKEFAESKGIELVDFDTLLKESDFIAIHVPLVKDTRNLINKDAIAKMKKGVIIINVARGPIVNEKDLLEALERGHVACAALDVFEQEPPPPDNPLVLSDKTICTPHLGASTQEAQDKVAIDIAHQVVDFFKYGVIKNSVNAPSISLEMAKQIGPYLKLSENLASVVASITDFPIKAIEIQYLGDVSQFDTKVLTQGILKNILTQQLEGVNYVNAPIVAKSRDIKVKEIKTKESEDFTSLITITVKGEKNQNLVEGTLFGKKEPRLIKINNIYLEADLKGNMLLIYNYDKPGVIASIGNVFFIRGINIGGMHFGRESIGGMAISLLDLDKDVEDNVIREIQSLPNVVSVKKIELGK